MLTHSLAPVTRSTLTRWATRIFLTGAIIALCVLASILATTVAAYADGNGGWPPVVGDTGTTPGTPGTPDGEPGCQNNCSGTGNGGTHDVYGGGSCPDQGDCHFHNGNLGGMGDEDYGVHIVVSCSSVTMYGFEESPTGYTYWYDIEWDSEGVGHGYNYGYVCNYPVVKDTQVTCAASITGVITQEVPAVDRRTVKTVAKRTDWASDKTNAAKCAGSLTISPNSTMNRLGGYLVTITGRTYTCTLREYPNGDRQARIIGCQGPNTTTQTAKAAVRCDGTNPNGWTATFGPGAWSLPDTGDWTWAGCTSTTHAPVVCAYGNSGIQWTADPADLTGFRKMKAQQDVMDDGQAHMVRFPKFTPKGNIVRILAQRSRLELIGDHGTEQGIRGISPYRAGSAPTADDQPFQFDGLGSSLDGDVRTYGFAFMAPGTQSGFHVEKYNAFDAIVTVETVKIVSINLDTMKFETSTVTINAKATDLSCHSDMAGWTVLRARNATH